jgi:putative flippase GtrA
MRVVANILNKTSVRYIILGIVCVVMDMGLLILMVEYLGFSYFNSNIFTFCVVNLFNYIVSRQWVFQPTGIKRRIEFPVFMVCVTVGLLISQLCLWYLVEYWNLDYRISKLVSTVLVVTWNFTTRKYLVFGLLSRFFGVKDQAM